MVGRFAQVLAVAGVLGVLLIAGTVPAGADIITPPGACVGSATWQSTGKTETSTDHNPDDVITVPAKDTVQWSGNQKGFAPNQAGPARPVSGEVKIEMPLGEITVDSWDGTSTKYGNSDTKSYDIPSVLKGIKVKLSGEHRENGSVTCSGSIYLKVDGGGIASPLGIAAIVGLVITGFLLFLAGKAAVVAG
jgi:hypothetical protein